MGLPSISHIGKKNIIPTRDITLLLKSTELVDKYFGNWDYQIPELNNRDVNYLICLSGGVDSCALCGVMLTKHPELYGRVTLLFTDTQNEPDGCYEMLDRLEYIFGISIVRLSEKSLFGMIDDNGGYLPSAKSRFCTKALKILPMNKFLQNRLLIKHTSTVITFSGLRYDERERMGVFGLDRVEAAFPFIEQKVDRAAVCSYASELGLMSTAYLHGRSRSGCKTCFFSSKQELISLYVWDTKSFLEGQAKEKICQPILDRFSQDKDQNLKSRGFYTAYPYPSLVKKGKHSFKKQTLFGLEREDVVGAVTWDYREGNSQKGKKRRMKCIDESQMQLIHVDSEVSNLSIEKIENGSKTTNQSDQPVVESKILEEETVLYVGVENYKHDFLNAFEGLSTNGVWQQRLITYSRTLGGLSRALSGYHYHRQMSSKIYFHDEDDYNAQSHICVLEIKFPKGVIPKITYGSDSYSWSSGRSYAEIAYVVRCIERVSELHVSKEILRQKQRNILTSYAESFIEDWEKDGSPNIGEICGVGHFRPKPINESQYDSYDEDIKTARCPICSI